MLDGKLIEGKHEKLISQEAFLQVNNIRAGAGGKYDVTHRKEIAEAPLKLFMKCDKCGRGYTSYRVVKKRKFKQTQVYYYYKCRTKGCNCNKKTDRVNEEFISFLAVILFNRT